MNRVRYFIFSTLFLACMAIPALPQQGIDVVYLKDGQVIRGVIVERIHGVSVKIVVGNNDVKTLDYSTIDKIDHEAGGDQSNFQYKPVNNTSHAALESSAPGGQEITWRPGGFIGLGWFRENSSFPEGSSSSDFRSSFLLGGVFEMAYNKYFSFEPGIEYARRGGEWSDGTFETYDIGYDYLSIPVNVKLKYPSLPPMNGVPAFSPYVLAGLNLGILLDASEEYDGGSNSVSLNSFCSG
jgi:hypothetical protein